MDPLHIFRNLQMLYSGNLEYYLNILLKKAKNLENPYHNLRHILYVTKLCYEACVFYSNNLSDVEKRDLLIAAIFHDFDHPGKSGNDDLNIEIAIRALSKYIHPEDRPRFDYISNIIRSTEYPHKSDFRFNNLQSEIIRDADLSQIFDDEWLQQIFIGLPSEIGIGKTDFLMINLSFLESLKLRTEWGQIKFGDKIKERCSQIRYLQIILS